MKKPRLLAVDDEASFTEMLRQYFEPRGYAIDIAPDGEKGLELIKNNVYDVALLDLKMTGIKGDQIMVYMKSVIPDIKVIFISAYSDSGRTKKRLMSAGAYAFLEKPITSLKSLEDLVNKAMKDKEGA